MIDDASLKPLQGYISSTKPYSGKVALPSLRNNSRNKIIEIGSWPFQLHLHSDLYLLEAHALWLYCFHHLVGSKLMGNYELQTVTRFFGIPLLFHCKQILCSSIFILLHC